MVTNPPSDGVFCTESVDEANRYAEGTVDKSRLDERGEHNGRKDLGVTTQVGHRKMNTISSSFE